MHLLGKSLKITLNPGTAKAKTVLDVPNYDFNNQAAHDNTPWLKVAPGDKLQVSCTYNPKLAQELPALRSFPRTSSPGAMAPPTRCASGSPSRCRSTRTPRRLGGPDGRESSVGQL